MAYLDEAGLQTLWTKIKNTFALIGHSHSDYVPTSRTVNGKALSSDVTLTASDLNAMGGSNCIGKSGSGSGPVDQNYTYNFYLPSCPVGGIIIIYNCSASATASNSNIAQAWNHPVTATANVCLPSGGTYSYIKGGSGDVSGGTVLATASAKTGTTGLSATATATTSGSYVLVRIA